MKAKKILVPLLIGILLLTGCGQTSTNRTVLSSQDEPHIHKYNDWCVIKAPTCVAGGLDAKYCTCSDVKTKKTNILPHVFSSWSAVKKPTCERRGQKIRTCVVCNKKETKDIEKLKHSYGQWLIEKAATCTTEGIKIRSCTFCKNTETSAIQKTEHSFCSWKVKKTSTCTSTGLKERVCACGLSETKDTSLANHSFGSWITSTESTTTKEGSQERACSVCGYKETKKVPRKKSAASLSSEINEMFSLINSARAEAGVSKLTYASDLQYLADIRVNELLSSFSHTRPDGRRWISLFDDYKISMYAIGENLAYGYRTVEGAFKGLYNSEGHRNNILNSLFEECVLGRIETQDGITYWVQLFVTRN